MVSFWGRREIIEAYAFITPDGELFPLVSPSGRGLVRLIAGAGMPPIRYLTQTAPEQHGATAIDFRLQPRLLTMTYREDGCSRNDYWQIRTAIIDALRPNRGPADERPAQGTLRIIRPDGAMRDIDVLTESTPSITPGTDWDEWAIQEPLRLIANDPTFYDPAAVGISFTFLANTQLVFPITFTPGVSIVFGGSLLYEASTIQYAGTWSAYPIFQITGPLNNPIITNASTDEKIELSYNIPNSTVVTIDLTTGVKTAVDDGGGNLLGVVTTDSDLGTWHLAPHPEVSNGTNIITVQGSNAGNNTAVTMTYHTRYIGV